MSGCPRVGLGAGARVVHDDAEQVDGFVGLGGVSGPAWPLGQAHKSDDGKRSAAWPLLPVRARRARRPRLLRRPAEGPTKVWSYTHAVPDSPSVWPEANKPGCRSPSSGRGGQAPPASAGGPSAPRDVSARGSQEGAGGARKRTSCGVVAVAVRGPGPSPAHPGPPPGPSCGPTLRAVVDGSWRAAHPWPQRGRYATPLRQVSSWALSAPHHPPGVSEVSPSGLDSPDNRSHRTSSRWATPRSHLIDQRPAIEPRARL